jgi:hypothetical protein
MICQVADAFGAGIFDMDAVKEMNKVENQRDQRSTTCKVTNYAMCKLIG